ncbi:MAG: hypothetical protein ACF8R7_02585 [Phycisphaerales bacterium JB039]
MQKSPLGLLPGSRPAPHKKAPGDRPGLLNLPLLHVRFALFAFRFPLRAASGELVLEAQEVEEVQRAGAYADCDGTGSLDFFDFLCFQNEFAAGCPEGKAKSEQRKANMKKW